jgi:YesN/AraC family two-component response regulator
MYDLIFTSIAKHPCITKKHVHTGWEVVYYLDCCGRIFIEDQEYSFQRGSIYVIPPNQYHYEISENEMNIACFSTRLFFSLEHKVIYFMDNANHDFLNLLKQLNTVNNLKPANWDKIKDGLLNVIEQYIISWSYTGNKNQIVHDFQYQLINAISRKDINLAELISQIPISDSYFRKLFKAETGKSPKQYIQDQRINNAKQLMINTTMNFKSIAILVGYSDPYYFSRIFKKTTGKYPLEWRKENLN